MDCDRLIKVVLTCTHNLCLEQKYEKYQTFSTEKCHFYSFKNRFILHRHVCVMLFAYAPGASDATVSLPLDIALPLPLLFAA